MVEEEIEVFVALWPAFMQQSGRYHSSGKQLAFTILRSNSE